MAINLATGAVLSGGIPLLTGHRGRWTEEETVLNRHLNKSALIFVSGSPVQWTWT